jgi:Cyclic nucleotide-binding domain
MSLLTFLLTLLPYIALVVALVFTQVLWLRVGLMVGFAAQLLYWLYVPSDVQYVHIAGVTAMLLVNLFHTVRLARARGLSDWSDEERYLQTTAFRSLPNESFKKLMEIAVWQTTTKGDILISEHQDVECLMLIYDGTATVHLEHKPITYLRENSFIGEMSFLTGNPASASVKAATNMRIITWNKAQLYDLMAKEADLKNGLQTLFSYDLADKLSKQNVRQPKTER